jgi:hypothetical protein
MKKTFNFRLGRMPARETQMLIGLVWTALWLAPAPARADFGCGESGEFAIVNAGCDESAVFTIDNSSCAESAVFVIDNNPSNADFDHDGDVDLRDLAVFRLCVSGSGIPYPAGCVIADFDHDGDVDQDDFGRFQLLFNVRSQLADPAQVEQPLAVPNGQHSP